MSKMSQLHMVITEAIDSGLDDDMVIELMVMEGLPREACPEILRVFKDEKETV
jgi:hypothetical protein